MSSRSILQVFETYQKARLAFVQSISDLAAWQSNIKCLEGTDVVELLTPLIDDNAVSVRRTATAAAAKLVEKSEPIAHKMISTTVLNSLLAQLCDSDVFFKRFVLQFIRGITRHNEELAAQVVKMDTLGHLVVCLEDFDTQVKENAAWALGLIARQNNELAQAVVDAGAIDKLVLCLSQPEISLKQIVSGVLEDMSHYQAQAVVDAGALSPLLRAAENNEPKLKRCALGALAAIAVCSEQLAEAVVAAGAIRLALTSPSATSARLIRNIVKHSTDLAQLAVDLGACGMLVQLLGNVDEHSCNSAPSVNMASKTLTTTTSSSVTTSSLSSTPVISPISPAVASAAAALGYIAAQSDQLALAVIASKAVPLLVKVLCEAVRMTRNGVSTEREKDCERWGAVCAAAWALGHIAQHSPQHSEAVAAAGAFPILLQLWESGVGGEEVRARCSCALRQALQCCLHRPALEPLLHTAPSPLLECVLIQYAKFLPHDPRARRLFVTTGALQRLQELPTEPGSQLQHLVSAINSCFPEEIVKSTINSVSQLIQFCLETGGKDIILQDFLTLFWNELTNIHHRVHRKSAQMMDPAMRSEMLARKVRHDDISLADGGWLLWDLKRRPERWDIQGRIAQKLHTEDSGW